MKQFYNWISPKWKAVYLIWLLLHFGLWFFAAHPFDHQSQFVPFGLSWWHIIDGDFKRAYYYEYDYTEFIFYMVVPIIIALIIYFWKQGTSHKKPGAHNE